MTPAELYSERLAQREKVLARFDGLHERIGSARLLLAVAFLILAWAGSARRGPAMPWLLIPAGLFVAAVLYHQRIRRLRGLAQRAVVFYRAGEQRLQGQYGDHGPRGERFIDEHHLYGADLDLFGKQSLYQRLCTARTPMGEAILAQWLLNPADLATIRERQTGIAELRGRWDLREDLAILGEPAAIALQPETITRWAEAPDELSQPWLRPSAIALTALAVLTAAVWAVWGLAFPFLAVLVLEAALQYAIRHQIHRAVAAVEHAYEDLKLLAALLRARRNRILRLPAAARTSLRSSLLTAGRRRSRCRSSPPSSISSRHAATPYWHRCCCR